MEPKGAVLFSHNASGNKEDPIIVTLHDHFYHQYKFTALRYNFYYVSKIDFREVKFEDLIMDLDSAYSLLLDNAPVKNVFLVGKSIGGVVSLEYLIQNNLRSPVIILGFYEPAITNYITEERLRELKSPVLVLQGENDEYIKAFDVRTVLERNHLNFKLTELKGGAHNLASNDENIRKSEDILNEIIQSITDFVGEFSS